MDYIFVKWEDFKKLIPTKNGVYKVYSIKKSGKPNPMQRVLAKDDEGIVYIGAAPKQSLKVRLNNFRLCVTPGYKTTNHSGGKRYKRLKSFREKYKFETLAIKFEVVAPSRAKKSEKKMLEDYCQKFGEVPPLNNSN